MSPASSAGPGYGFEAALLALATSLAWRFLILRRRRFRVGRLLLEHLALPFVAAYALHLAGITNVPHPTLDQLLNQVCGPI